MEYRNDGRTHPRLRGLRAAIWRALDEWRRVDLARTRAALLSGGAPPQQSATVDIINPFARDAAEADQQDGAGAKQEDRP